MLKKQFRLKSKSAFNATYKVKNSTHKGGVTLFAGIKKDEKPSGKIDATLQQPAKCDKKTTKVGFVVSKKTHKRAVKRNRLKRLMRESYRLLLKSGNAGNSQEYLSLIFVGHSNAVGKDFKEIQKCVKTLIDGLK
ncbi:ribonuclease P protein component [bacterium]|nr:ribonuclease P protein component [bacterium]